MKKILVLIGMVLIFLALNINVFALNSYPENWNSYGTNYTCITWNNGYQYFYVYNCNSDQFQWMDISNSFMYLKYYTCTSWGRTNNNGVWVHRLDEYPVNAQLSWSPIGESAYKLLETNKVVNLDESGNGIFDTDAYIAPTYKDYYIDDDAGMFDSASIQSLLSVEKKFEKNCKLQVFINTHSTAYTDELSSVYNFTVSKSPSGNGVILIDIYKNSNGTYRFVYSGTYQTTMQVPDVAIGIDIRSNVKYADEVTTTNIVKVLNSIYEDYLYSNFANDVYGTYINGSLAGYNLANSKLTPHSSRPSDTADGGIFGINIGLRPVVTPPSGGVIVLPTPPPKPSPNPGDPQGLEIEKYGIDNKLPYYPLEKTMSKLVELQGQSYPPPKLIINLNHWFQDFSTHFGVNNNFENVDTVVVDFGEIEDYHNSAGETALSYFQTLIGAIFVFWTVAHMRKRVLEEAGK